ncbi:hypothetical protein CMI41_03485 [Candidatus Pacearchaeota archaeon]|nr:hypothetical protein [Candidatus Pacearchaeota archaeon]
MKKGGQLTLLVIAGIVAILLALIYVLVVSDYNILDIFNEDISDPNLYLESCLAGDISEIVNSFLENNFYYEEIEENFFLYNDEDESEKVPYLCKVGEFYSPCINQEPNLPAKLKQDLLDEIIPLAENCWLKMAAAYERNGYVVETDGIEVDIVSRQENFEIQLEGNMKITSTEETEAFEAFEIQIDSHIFNLASLATEIVNFESTLCEFDYINWMNTYNDIFISRYRAGDQTKIYTLKDRYTDEEIKFAIKTCVLPAGT